MPVCKPVVRDVITASASVTWSNPFQYLAAFVAFTAPTLVRQRAQFELNMKLVAFYLNAMTGGPEGCKPNVILVGGIDHASSHTGGPWGGTRTLVLRQRVRVEYTCDEVPEGAETAHEN